MKFITKDYLMSLVGNTLTLTLFDGTVLRGKLNYCDSFCSKHGYRQPKYFYIGNMSFKVSHVKKITEII